MQAHEERERDLRVVRSLLEAIETGNFPVLAEYEREFRVLLERLSQGAYSGDLWEFLAAQPDVANEGMKVAVARTLSFVKDEVAMYSRIKATRPLSDAEKNYGKNILLPLLESARTPSKGDR